MTRRTSRLSLDSSTPLHPSSIPLDSVAQFPIYTSGSGKTQTFFVLNPKSRRKLPADLRVHCYATSAEAAARLADIFNADYKLTFGQYPKKGIRKPSFERLGKTIDTPSKKAVNHSSKSKTSPSIPPTDCADEA